VLPMFDLTGRAAIVTGGNGGIGLGMARALLQAGARVSIWGSNPDKTEKARAELASFGDVHALVCDVGDEQAVDAAFAQSLASLGRVDACFANAGVSSFSTPIAKMGYDEFRRVMRINLDGVFFTFRAASRHMIDQGDGGSLVVTASTAAVEGAARNSHYGASKGAVTSYVRALAVELARYRIRVNSILPGWIESEMTSGIFGESKFADAVLPRIPLRRWGKPEDFAGIAVFLASDASSYMTGADLLIDGGYTKF
jgi:NAD(P)-dependent dehydrogenase (short-subunit alcohol dehydrogenase family)